MTLSTKSRIVVGKVIRHIGVEMQTKLTLRMDDRLIQRAKIYARQSGRSLSKIVSDYLSLLDSPTSRLRSGPSPTVAKLRGALSDAKLDKREYNLHLEEKYL